MAESGDGQDKLKGTFPALASLETDGNPDLENSDDDEGEGQVEDTESLKGSQFPAGISDAYSDNATSSKESTDNHYRSTGAVLDEGFPAEKMLDEANTGTEARASQSGDHVDKVAIDDMIAETTISHRKPSQLAKSLVYDSSLDGGGVEQNQEIKPASIASQDPFSAYSLSASSDLAVPNLTRDAAESINEVIPDAIETIDKAIVSLTYKEPNGKATNLDLVKKNQQGN